MSTISILLIIVAFGCLGWFFKTKEESTKTVCVIAFLVFFIWGITMIGTERKPKVPKEPKREVVIVYDEEPEDEEPVYEKYLQVEPEREEHEDTLVVPRGGLTEEQKRELQEYLDQRYR